jgi:hypothetical protein
MHGLLPLPHDLHDSTASRALSPDESHASISCLVNASKQDTAVDLDRDFRQRLFHVAKLPEIPRHGVKLTQMRSNWLLLNQNNLEKNAKGKKKLPLDV